MRQLILLPLLLLLAVTLGAQERPLNTGLTVDEQYALIGMTIADVIEHYGPPRTVAVARGIELWQDDVVFQYTGVDFYIYRDRVWQVKFNTIHGISNGDPKTAVLLTLGNTVEDKGDHVLFPVSGRDWQLMLRVNFNNTGQVSSIFLYRPGF